MSLSIESKLKNTRNLLQELGNSVSNLFNLSPDIFGDPSMESCLEEFKKAHQEAVDRLENPSFRIATIGTTSSGKSTIVNALIGRRIAPIEAGEMSGGVLTLKHSLEHRLAIAPTEDAAWDTGEWTGLNDEDLYRRICMVMRSYHDARKKRDYVAPQVAAYIPLLPASNPFLLGLPEGIEVELIDLPGLKSVQDQTNLATIQKQVNKAFSLVSLDYMQIDDDHRKRLLEELKKVVEYLQGRTDSMIFILNRVDQRGSDDLPLSLRIDKLRAEIQEVLSLQELPDVLPFNARFLYYAQCASGAGALNKPSAVTSQARLNFLKAMFQDCAGVIHLNTKDNRSLRNWFRDIADRVEDNETIDDETMSKILHYSLEWSGGRELWQRFQRRFQDSFAELVILPALVEVFDNYFALSQFLDILVQARKIYNQEQVEQQREKIAKIQQNFPKSINKIGKEFKAEIEQLIEDLKTNKPEHKLKIKQEATKKDRKGFFPIFNAISEVEGNLNIVLVIPVRDALKNNQGAFELQDNLREVISPFLAEDIAKTYDKLSRRLSQFSCESEYLVKRVRSDDEKGKKELEHDERHVRLLYHTMKKAISARAEFVLQGKVKQFEQALESLVNEQIKRLRICLAEENLKSSIDLQQAVISDLYKKLAQKPPTLPDNFFDISDTIKQNRSQTTEVVDTKTEYEDYIEPYQEGSCFKSTQIRVKKRPITRNITAEVEYIELFLPSPDLMAQQWLNGIEKRKERLWDILREWILEQLDDISNIFEKSVKDITNLADRALQQQLSIIEDNFEQEKYLWESVELQKDEIAEICQKLKKEV